MDEKRAQKKADHWKKIAQSACAQCNRSTVPVIDKVIPLGQWLERHHDEYSLLIHPGAEQTFKDLTPVPTLNLLVGPEGGFSSNELKLTAEAGVGQILCGPRTLRTETAGFAAIAIIQSLIGDMS